MSASRLGLLLLSACAGGAEPVTRVFGEGQGLTVIADGGPLTGGVSLRGGGGNDTEVLGLGCPDQPGAILHTLTEWGQGDEESRVTARALMCNGFDTANDLGVIPLDHPPATSIGLRDFQVPLVGVGSAFTLDPDMSTENLTLRTPGVLLVGRWIAETAVVSGVTADDPSAGEISGDMAFELRNDDNDLMDEWVQQASIVWGFDANPVVKDAERQELPF